VKAMIESTSKVVELDARDRKGIFQARIWEGVTESGIPFHAFIVRVAVEKDSDNSQFETELKETKAPTTATQSWPLRMIL
jgi:hypothetical protein